MLSWVSLSLSSMSSTALWVLGQFGGKAALGKGLASSWPNSGLAPDQGMGATRGRVAQLHPCYPNPTPCTPNTLRWGRHLHSPLTTSTCRTTSSEFWLLTQDIPHLRGAGGVHPPTIQPHRWDTRAPLGAGVVSSTGVTCSGQKEQLRVPRVRMLCTEDGWGPGHALPHAAAARGSVWAFHPCPEHPPG